MDIEKVSNILGADTAKKIYEDAASKPIQETSKIAVDLIKSLRLITAPLQLLASYQDRLTVHLNKITQAIPEEDLIEAPTSLSGPVIEKLKFLENDNYLTQYYIELLTRACDKKRINEAHPAFFHIIEQLSPDEALILYKLKHESRLYFSYTRELDKANNLFKKIVPIDNTQIVSGLIFFEHYSMYLEHLQSLNLIYWTRKSEDLTWNDPETKKDQIGVLIKTSISLTAFGELFVKACIPNFFISQTSE